MERRRRRLRRTLAVGSALVVLLAVVLVLSLSGGGSSSSSRSPHSSSRPSSTTGGRRPASSTAPATGTGTGTAPAVEARVLPWSLASPISREVVLPGPAHGLLVVGGLSASQQSLASVTLLDTVNGSESTVGTLPDPVHDASGALIGGAGVVLGGGSPDTVATVQAFPLPNGPSSVSAPSVSGELPQPRSDSGSATIGSTTYVVGGYDGSAPDPAVLATTDGRHFSTVAELPVPVRYPAVAALGGVIYAFGGQAVGGAESGQPVDVVQAVNPSGGTARVVGHLPAAVAGASAAALGGHLYVAGGVGSISSDQPGPALGEVWAFDPARNRAVSAGSLPAPTSYAGTVVAGGRAWLVGGESSGSPVAAVESLTPGASARPRNG